jgi:hypothetical protein
MLEVVWASAGNQQTRAKQKATAIRVVRILLTSGEIGTGVIATAFRSLYFKCCKMSIVLQVLHKVLAGGFVICYLAAPCNPRRKFLRLRR